MHIENCTQSIIDISGTDEFFNMKQNRTAHGYYDNSNMFTVQHMYKSPRAYLSYYIKTRELACCHVWLKREWNSYLTPRDIPSILQTMVRGK